MSRIERSAALQCWKDANGQELSSFLLEKGLSFDTVDDVLKAIK